VLGRIAAGAALVIAVVVGCMVVEGPCTVTIGMVSCDRGGLVKVLGTAHTIEAAGKVVDQSLAVPARERH
jgi:hypothetical protein